MTTANGRRYHDEWSHVIEVSGFTGLYQAGAYKAKTGAYEEYICANGRYAYDRGRLWVSTVIRGTEAGEDYTVRLAGAITSPRGGGAGNLTMTYTAPVILLARTPTEV
jgi:hypothetical protein